MNKIIIVIAAFLLANISMGQELSAMEKSKKDLIEIKRIINVTDDQYQYIETLLIYYYNNGGDNVSEDNANLQIAKNVHEKIRAKLSTQDFEILYEEWLKTMVR
ncbi:hypothetical protein H4O18_15390 [Arenibacter sp. BSSL-BM3]|uniref:Uncharacterized protein n=1 Tax=Arenibacter arenosicollis TaxID=2762274 RepID=A0ABR7QQZ1_9FLAO|nr:hypothetical protein [Arenibacter arenosicollis]MBC8769380.1 hypothetical protein [Arenibacter arenosicollis]